MASSRTSDMPSDKETEFAINQWKIDLVGTFFLKKQERSEKPSRKQALVFEDCDVSSICVSHDDTTENIFDDNEGTLTSSPVPASASGNSAGSTCSSGGIIVANNHDVVKDNTTKLEELLCQKTLCNKLKGSKQGKSECSIAELDVGNTRILEIEARKQFPQDLKKEGKDWSESDALGTALTSPAASSTIAVSSSVSNCLNSQVTSTRPLTMYKNKVPQLNKPFTSSGSALQASNIEDQDRNCIPVGSEAAVSSSAKPVLSPATVSALAIPALVVSVSCTTPISSVMPVTTALLVSSSGPVPTIRPLLLNKSSVPPASKTTDPDQGRNCVSVILKSSRLDPKPARLNIIAKRLEKVEQLVSRYSLMFGHKSSPGVQVRLDYCFHMAVEARQFFIAIHSLEQSKSPPKLLSCFLLSESNLGYDHDPVLTEYDLLAIQSPSYCRNIFRTPVPIKVVQMGDTVGFRFKSVTDVNRFLFNKSGSMNTRSLGYLRMNVVPKKMVHDDEGLYRLFTEERDISPKFGDKHKFNIKAKMEYGDDVSLLGGNLLLFSNKFELFKFLFSEDAADLDHLQFDKTKIVNCPDAIVKMGARKIKFSRKLSEKRTHQSGKEDKVFKIEFHGENDLQKEEVNKLEALKPPTVTELLQEAIEDTDLSSASVLNCDNLPRDQLCLKVAAGELLQSRENEDNVNTSQLVEEGKEPENEESTEISTPMKNVGNETVQEAVDEAELRRALALKKEEISKLKRKLLAKEKLIETEIQRKSAVNSELKEVRMQLEKIHQLSLSRPGNVGPLD